MDQELQKLIEACFPILDAKMDKTVKITFVETREEALSAFHFGLGLWIRNHLLEEDAQLYRCFLRNGVVSRDEMSAEIVKQYWERSQA